MRQRWWLLPAVVVWMGASPQSPGLTLEAPPASLPHQLDPAPTLEIVRADVSSGDRVRALRTAERYLEVAEPSRERTAVQFLVGTLHREAGRHNLASEAFTRARRAKGPLAEWAAYYEAEQDMVRGRVDVAIDECNRYRRTYRDGHHEQDCLRLIALARASQGDVEAARESAAEYDKANRLGPISEQVELALARRKIEAGTPVEAVPILRALAIEHRAPLAGRVAEEALEQLRAGGIDSATVPDDPESLMARARSLRDSKRLDEAWELFTHIASQSSDIPELSDFVEAEAERFGWRTRRWDFLAHWYRDKYVETNDSKYAWSRYRVLFRGGRHDEASTYALQMQRKHGSDRRWKSSHEDVGRTMMLAGRYLDARKQFERAGASKWARRARFYAAFATLMAGEHKQAVDTLTTVARNERGWGVEARYWRAKAHEALGAQEAAAADRAWVVEHDPYSWYATWVSAGETDAQGRSGQWPGTSFVPEPKAMARTFGQGMVKPATLPVFAPYRPVAQDPVSSLRMASAWPFEGVDRPLTPPSVLVASSGRFPPQTSSGTLWNDADSRVELARFAARYGRYWPELKAVNDLATVGLYDLSGPLMASWYESWRRDYRRRRRTARRVRHVSEEQWRAMFFAARDHHHASRNVYGWWEEQPDATRATEARRLGYPIAHGSVVWDSAREHGVDPYLVLGLMRQESNYRANAVSRVGARGAMQIMPTTGHLLADLTRDVEFTAGDLNDPTLSVDYGIRYMGLLLHRFEGVFPLAVASYNGGPFNVSNWMSGPAGELPMDAFVEHIPFRETRDYVKRVTAWYATYVDLYAAQNDSVVIPVAMREDHSEVVDF